MALKSTIFKAELQIADMDRGHYGTHALTLAHEQLCWALLSHLACHSPAGDTGSAFSPGERWQVVRRAEQYLRECDSASVRIEDLCRAACTSLSRLERAFRETFGVSPRRYLTLLRLAAVRRELLRHEAGASVTQVATRWGLLGRTISPLPDAMAIVATLLGEVADHLVGPAGLDQSGIGDQHRPHRAEPHRRVGRLDHRGHPEHDLGGVELQQP